MARPIPKNVDEYIATFPVEVQIILKKMRSTVQENAPDARELISYGIPAFAQDGIVIYFAAFKNHIGIYPPVHGDARLENAVAKYAGPKGNLKLPFAEPIPYSLIARIVRFRVKQRATRSAKHK